MPPPWYPRRRPPFSRSCTAACPPAHRNLRCARFAEESVPQRRAIAASISCQETIRARKRAPSSYAWLLRPRRHRRMLSVRGEIFRRRADGIAANWKNPSALARLAFRSRTRSRAFFGGDLVCERDRPRQQILLEELVEQPAVLELLEGTELPETIMLSARFRADEPGRRCVPPRRASAPASPRARRSGPP